MDWHETCGCKGVYLLSITLEWITLKCVHTAINLLIPTMKRNENWLNVVNSLYNIKDDFGLVYVFKVVQEPRSPFFRVQILSLLFKMFPCKWLPVKKSSCFKIMRRTGLDGWVLNARNSRYRYCRCHTDPYCCHFVWWESEKLPCFPS